MPNLFHYEKHVFWNDWLRRLTQCPLLYILAYAQSALSGKHRNSLFLLVCDPERNSIFFLHKSTPYVFLVRGIGELPKEKPSALGLRGNLWHTSSLLVTLQDSLSPPQIDMFASYRSFKGQSQVCTSWNIRKTQIIRLREYTGKDFPPSVRILLSDGGFGQKCLRVFLFCHHKSSNAMARRFETFAHR